MYEEYLTLMCKADRSKGKVKKQNENFCDTPHRFFLIYEARAIQSKKSKDVF